MTLSTDRRAELGEAATRTRADAERSRLVGKAGFDDVALVENDDARRTIELELVQEASYRDALTRPIRICGVEDFDQKIGFAQLFERRAKRVDEILRKIGDESDRVGEAYVTVRSQVDAANRRIEGGKRLVGYERIAIRQRVEQRGLSDVGISDQRDERLAAPRSPPRCALPPYVFELTAQHRNASADPPAIDFEFGFARAARADATAQSRQIRADADEIRLTIAQLRQLDLQLTFAAACVARKDVENEHRPIDDRQRHDSLEVLPLTRTQVVEHQHHSGAQFLGALGDFARFAAADERRGIDCVAALYDAIDDARAGRFGERFELEELRLQRTARVSGVDRDDDRRLRRYVASGVNRSTSQWSPSL